MVKAANVGYSSLVERIVRNEDIFCSLLFDYTNRTLRVVDFRGGNFQSKHEYLEHTLMKEGMRKIFTLIERDDINGWQRVGYQREGAIPGYYKRSDAYIMSRIYDVAFDAKDPQGEDIPENKNLLNDIKMLGKKLSDMKEPTVSVNQVGDAEAYEALQEELERSESRTKKSKPQKEAKGAKKVAKPAKTKKSKTPVPSEMTSVPSSELLFPPFSREVEYFHYVAQNRRTKQKSIISTEYQDCFGNAKVHFCIAPESKGDQNLARTGLSQTIDQLTEMGAVSIFATAPVGNLAENAIYAALGFRNTGWMSRQVIRPEGPEDVILWTKKLI
jgi:hypothetical protein